MDIHKRSCIFKSEDKYTYPLESQGLELDVFSFDSLTRGGSSRPGRAGKSLPFISNSGAGLKATGGPP